MNSVMLRMDNLQLKPEDGVPPELELVLRNCWNGYYAEIDQSGQDDLAMAVDTVINRFVSAYGREAERPLLEFFIALSWRAEMWLNLARPNDPNPNKVMEVAINYLNTGHIIPAVEADLILPPQQERSGDICADEAYLVLHFLVHSLDPLQLRKLATPFLHHALTSCSIVIPEAQRRAVLRWCLEEGLPAVWANRSPRKVCHYLY